MQRKPERQRVNNFTTKVDEYDSIWQIHTILSSIATDTDGNISCDSNGPSSLFCNPFHATDPTEEKVSTRHGHYPEQNICDAGRRILSGL